MPSVPLIMTLLFMGLTLVNSDSPEVNVADGNKNEVRPLFGPTAPLKPLEKVPGTNLFYDFPYKWFDETKQGCFVTFFWEFVEGTITPTSHVKNRQVTLACNNADQKLYESTDSDWIIEHPKEDRPHLDDEIILRNVGAEEALERLYPNRMFGSDTTWLMVDGYNAEVYAMNGEKFYEHMWMIRADPNNENRVTIVDEGRTVSQLPLPNHRAALILGKGFDESYPYSFAPSISMELKIIDCVFDQLPADELDKHTSQEALMDAIEIKNDGPGTMSRGVSVSKIVKSEFSYGFSQSIKTGFKVTGSVGIPLVAEGKVENNFEQQVGANQNWKSATGKSFQMTYDVKVPAYTKVNVSAWCDLIKDVRMDFTATVEVYGKIKRISQFDDFVNDVPATGDMIRNQFVNIGFEGDILDVAEDHVIVKIRGDMTATTGVRGRLNLDGESLKTSETV